MDRNWVLTTLTIRGLFFSLTACGPVPIISSRAVSRSLSTVASCTMVENGRDGIEPAVPMTDGCLKKESAVVVRSLAPANRRAATELGVTDVNEGRKDCTTIWENTLPPLLLLVEALPVRRKKACTIRRKIKADTFKGRCNARE